TAWDRDTPRGETTGLSPTSDEGTTASGSTPSSRRRARNRRSSAQTTQSRNPRRRRTAKRARPGDLATGATARSTGPRSTAGAPTQAAQAENHSSRRTARTESATATAQPKDHRSRKTAKKVGLGVFVGVAGGAVMGDWVAGMLAAPMVDLDALGVALSRADIAWAGVVNLVAATAMLGVAGRMADLVGRRDVLAVGLALYVLGASAVIVAPSWAVLVGARLGQGAGIALMVPAALGMLLGELPERRRAAGAGLWVAACAGGALGMLAGGGWLLDTFGWRGLFLPGAVTAAVLLLFAPVSPRSVGAASGGAGESAAACRRGLPRSVGAASGVLRAVLAVAGVAAAVLALARGGVWGWTSALTLGCAGAALLLLGPAKLTRRPRAGWAGVVSGVCGAVFFALLTTAGTPPFWLVATAAAAPLAAKIIQRRGADAVVLGGALALGSGCALLLARPYPPYGMLAGALLAGAGLGALATGALAMGAAAAGRERLAAGVATVDTARLVGAAAGLAGAAALTMGGAPGEPGDAVLLAC